MAKLKDFADQGTPLFTDLNAAAPGLSKATVEPAAVRQRGHPRPDQRSATRPRPPGPKLVASDGLLTDLARPANSSVPVGQNFSAFLDTFAKTQGFQYLMDFIYNSAGSINGFDAFGHFLRSNLQLTSCVEVVRHVRSPAARPSSAQATPPPPTKKKEQEGQVSRKGGASAGARRCPRSNVPNLQDLTPAAHRPDQTPTTTDARRLRRGPPAPTPARPPPTPGAPARSRRRRPHAISMNEAQMFLQFLLGGGA